MVRRTLVWFVAAVFALATLVFTAAPARADDSAQTYVVAASLTETGMLKVTGTLTLGATPPATVEHRLATFLNGDDGVVYTYTISDLTVTSGGKDLGASVSDKDGYKVVSVNTAGLSGPIVYSYTVDGTTIARRDGSVQFGWRVLQGFNIAVGEVSGKVSSRVIATDYQCVSGPPSATQTCQMYSGGTHDSMDLEFTDGPRGAGEVVSVGMLFDKGAVPVTEHKSYRWSLDRAFTPGSPQLLATLGALLVGGLALWTMHRRTGRDAVAARPTLVAEFRPVGPGEADFVVDDAVRPGHVGTVADEHVDPVDIVGTLLDLAVRGHLLITQLPRESRGFADWTLTRKAGGDEPAPFEKRLLEAVAPEGQSTKVSELAANVVPAVREVQSDLYEEIVERGWYKHRPDRVRSGWASWGWIGIAAAAVAAVLLVIFTTYGLLGLALLGLALGLLFVAQEMPARTESGAALLAGLRALSVQLDTQPTNQLPAGREYEVVSRILPYAVVLGGWERWLAVLAEADNDADPDPEDLSWYHAPADWHLAELPAALDTFVNTVRGRLFAR